MRGIYLQKNSPFYWIRYYDKTEVDPRKRRKSINTKIEVTPSDKRRHTEGEKLVGTHELKRLVGGFKQGLNEKYILAKTGIRIKKELKLSEGYDEFKTYKSTPGLRKGLKKKTLINYDIAIEHFIKANGDRYIYKYTDKDYLKLLNYFEELQIPVNHEKDKFKSLSTNSRSIYTRSLSALWNYFISKNYCSKNIIEPTDAEEKEPDPIASDEMYAIIKYLKNLHEHPQYYWITYFMLLTGCRPSSAMVQLKEDIDFKRKIITIQNVKSGRRKKKSFYRFPLYKELFTLLYNEMKTMPGDSGRLFNMYSLNPENYTYPLSFWDRRIKLMLSEKIISKRYILKQIRPTFISFLINILKMDIYKVFKLADHADIKITDKHYINLRLENVRKELDEITLNSFLVEE